MPVFSVTPTLAPQERIPQHVELQLLPDDELMDRWDAEGALRYSGVLVWEMQRRLAGRPPAQRFGSGGLPPEARTEIFRRQPTSVRG